MDRPLAEEFKRKLALSNFLKVMIITAFLILIILFVPTIFESSISRSRIRTSIVETGDVLSTITCTGIIEPEIELVLTSPIDTKVEKILKTPGSSLKKNERILELDLTEHKTKLNNIKEQIQLKINQQKKLKLDYDKKINDLKSEIKIKELSLEVLISKAEQQQNLYKIGGTSKESMNQAVLSKNIAEIEFEKMKNTLNLENETYENQHETLNTEISLLKEEQKEIARLLNQAEARSNREGVLTWVIENEGESIQKGEVIAKIADLNSFKVKGTISDIHASKIYTGQQVIIKLNEDELSGLISVIFPTIENGTITFYANLKDKSNRLLKSNLRVDVYPVIDKKENVLRIKNGPFAGGQGSQNVFIVEGNSAVKKKVTLGISNFDFYEIIDGLKQGDEVIISDMNDYMHHDKIKITN